MAKVLEEAHVQFDGVISISAPDEVLVERLSGRRLCRNCGKGYHDHFEQPKTPGVCDVCGGTVFTVSGPISVSVL